MVNDLLRRRQTVSWNATLPSLLIVTTLIVGCTEAPAQGNTVPPGNAGLAATAGGAPNPGGAAGANVVPPPENGAGGAATRPPPVSGGASASGGRSAVLDAAELPGAGGGSPLADAGAVAAPPLAGAALPDASTCKPGTTLTADGNCLLGTPPEADGGCPSGTATSDTWYAVPQCKAYVDCVVASLCAVSTVQSACEAAARDKLQASNCFPTNEPISSDEWAATCERERQTLAPEFPACASE